MKITIQNIEHISWAKRLIITWYIQLAPSDPLHGNWEYLLSSCGYRNVCDEEWIVMEPNTQHPQHSDVIVAPGTNVFVWDYGGIKGLDPKDFDSTHSYVVQIAAIDSGCNWIDPCTNDQGEYIYTTPGGEVPIGQPGTLGSDDDLFNNCGDGWELLEDEFGCLYCNKLSTTPPGTGTTTPSGQGIVTSDEDWEPWTPGGGWGGNPIGRPRVLSAGGGGNGNDPPIYPTPDPRGWDTPEYDPPGGGCGGPIVVGGDGDNDGDDDGSTGVPPTGLSGTYTLDILDIFDNDDGLTTKVITDVGGESSTNEWIGSTFGGREADWFNIVSPIDGHNANFPVSTTRYTAERKDKVPSKQAGLNISPNSVPSSSNNSTLNNVPGRSDSANNPSKIVSAITSKDGTISINGSNNISSADGINPTKEGVRSARSIRPSGIDSTFIDAKSRGRNANDARELILRGSQQYKGDSSSSVRSGRSREDAGHPRIKGAGEVTRIKNTPEFNSQYDLKLIASPIGVNRIFADCRLNIIPRASKELRLRVYFSQDKIDHLIGESPLKTSSDPRIVSITAPLGAVRGGEVAYVYAIVDDGDKIIGRKVVSVTMPDAGSRRSSGSNLTVSSNKQSTGASNLVRPSDSIEIYMNTAKSLIVNCYVGARSISDIIELGAYSISEAGLDTSLEIYDADDVSYMSETTIPVFSSRSLVNSIPNGIKINSLKHSSVIYKNIEKPSGFTVGQENNIVTIVNRSSTNKSDNITLAVGPHVFIRKATIPSPPTAVNTDGTIDIAFANLSLLNNVFSVYESGGNNVTPDDVSTYEFTSDLSGGGTVNIPVTQIPTFIGLAVYDSGSLFRRTLKWFRIG